MYRRRGSSESSLSRCCREPYHASWYELRCRAHARSMVVIRLRAACSVLEMEQEDEEDDT